MITSIDTDFTVTDPPELVEQIEILARRCAAATRAARKVAETPAGDGTGRRAVR
ncbi:hypothetical protein ABT297_31955 [Dactylosporangium sp. NPDC000555]|uniref:hypothetical protein n=1 Tax=Dactylosporangium sp. NPDC000555 TaxID=3154260 RepID=UPI00332EDA54